MGNKVTELITKVYHYLLTCFYFWLGLFRGIIIYALIPALVALYMTIDHMKQNPDYSESDLKKVYQHTYKKYQHHKLTSFFVSFGFILLATFLFFLVKNGASWIFIGVVSYFVLLLFATISYTTYYLAFKATTIKSSFALGFVGVIKNMDLTLSIILLFVLSVWLAFYNLVLFLILFPVIFGLMIVNVFPRKLNN